LKRAKLTVVGFEGEIEGGRGESQNVRDVRVRILARRKVGV